MTLRGPIVKMTAEGRYFASNEDFAKFTTRRFSTLTTFSGHLKCIISHKITQYYKLYVYFNLYVYS